MDTELLRAFKGENIEKFRAILSLPRVDINAKDANGNTLLHLATKKFSKFEYVDVLIEAGANVNIKNCKEETALNLAFVHHAPGVKSEIMRKLINAGADVNTRSTGENGWTALHEAAMTADHELVKLIVDLGADVNATDYIKNWTPLHTAAAHVCRGINRVSDDPSIFEILLSANADVNARSAKGRTPLYYLVKDTPLNYFSYTKMIQVFAKYGADFLATDNKGQGIVETAVANENTSAVKALVLSGAVSVNSEFAHDHGDTILHGACYHAGLPLVKFLLKNGADINARDKENMTPLLYAVASVNYHQFQAEYTRKSMDVLKYLFKKNVDVNTCTMNEVNILNLQFIGYSIPDHLWQANLEHLAIVYMTGGFIGLNLRDSIIQDEKYGNYYDKCINELQHLKEHMLHEDSYVNLFKLLVENKSKLFNYAGNGDLVNGYKEIRVTTRYPIYGDALSKRFSKALHKRKIADQAAKILSDILPIKTGLKHTIIFKILSFFKPIDLETLFVQTIL